MKRMAVVEVTNITRSRNKKMRNIFLRSSRMPEDFLREDLDWRCPMRKRKRYNPGAIYFCLTECMILNMPVAERISGHFQNWIVLLPDFIPMDNVISTITTRPLTPLMQ